MKNRATAQIKCELENYGVYTDSPNQGVCMRKSMKSKKSFVFFFQEKNSSRKTQKLRNIQSCP